MHTSEDLGCLCCSECDNELTPTPQGGYYCTHCRFYPSMQDTFIRYPEKPLPIRELCTRGQKS